ncbi:MAG TPA: DUF362 domain-containing protein [Bryobacteraceae bacterium]|nr:DUF362 domain-containing protein [Bryobacteraceae bacterium]
MQRRTFLTLAAASPALGATLPADLPRYRVVSHYAPAEKPGMPGRFPGLVARVRSEAAIDTTTEKINAPVVQQMISRGMRELTGATDARDAWRSFFEPADVVGIKVNCSGAPQVMSSPEVVAEIVRNLMTVGVPANQIWIYERFPDQMKTVGYEKYVPQGVHVDGIEKSRGAILGYDPRTYVEVDFFGEDDTRSMLVRHVSERFTKIINVPNMKDHGAAGVTGCLKNIAYGNFSNVARSHQYSKTNTLSFIGTLASVEPLRSKTVLHVMDGMRGVWHGGPFLHEKRFRFYPKEMMFGTDPVAMDRLLLDVIEQKRREENAISVWERSNQYVHKGFEHDPNANNFVREPGHIEFASGLGLGVYDVQKIHQKAVTI